MKTDNIAMKFNNEFMGSMTSPKGEIQIGSQDNGQAPYHLLYGALGSCFFATFLSIANKMRLTFDDADLEISGTKRDESPATLEKVIIDMVVYNPSDEARLEKAAQLGAQHCSIHETISRVADIKLNIVFKEK
jgi:putative redox protein